MPRRWRFQGWGPGGAPAVGEEVCHGRACITGTRVLVTTVLDNLAAGLDSEEITRSYPSVTPESVRAAMCYAAELGA